MNRKAMAEGCEWKGYLCYEAGTAATCMASCPPRTLIRVRDGLRAAEVVGEGRVDIVYKHCIGPGGGFIILSFLSL